MQGFLNDVIGKYKSKIDYLEIRIEESEGTEISFRGKEMENVSQPFGKGGCVRALAKGGWGFVSFNELSSLDKKVEMAIAQAKLVGKEKSQLAKVESREDIVLASFSKSPFEIALSQKVNLMKEYNDLLWSAGNAAELAGRQICDTSAIYADGKTKTFFASSEGTYLEQEFPEVAAAFSVNARDADLVQRASFSVGDPTSFSIVENLHEKVKETAKMAVKLLQAPPVRAGTYTVILNPDFTGTFIHEAFGHLSEADYVYENPELKKLMVLGKKMAVSNLNVVDDPTLPNLRGSYKYDDEGVRASKTYLIKNGRLTGRLHSRETAGKMKETPTGNARAAGFHSHPRVRMSNTYVEAGSVSFKNMISDIKLGVYAVDSLGGHTDHEMFTFTAKWGLMIRNGNLAELVRDVKLTGNLFTTLKNIEAIGDDLKIKKHWGACGKGGQWVPIAAGGPHVRIKKVTIGGQ